MTQKEDDMREKPMTLEELRKMHGEPVWVVGVSSINGFNGHWDILDLSNGNLFFPYCMEEGDAGLYGISWKAYRRKAEHAKSDGWIPTQERLPENFQKVLVWYEYFRYGSYNCMYQTYGIGYQINGIWGGDVSGQEVRCIAWQPLPEPYRCRSGDIEL